MKADKKPLGRKDDIVVQELDGEVLIYDLKVNKVFCLNQTSALVWQACDGKRTIAEINNWLGQHLDSQTNEDIVWLALDQLSKENLIENKNEIENKFSAMPRREVVKKLGMGSLIALPVIASLTAPAAAQTGTCAGRCGATLACPQVSGCVCSNPTQNQNNGTCGRN